MVKKTLVKKVKKYWVKKVQHVIVERNAWESGCKIQRSPSRHNVVGKRNQLSQKLFFFQFFQ